MRQSIMDNSNDDAHLHVTHNPERSELAKVVNNTVNFFEEYLDFDTFSMTQEHTLPVIYVIKSKVARLEPDTSYQLDPADDEKDIVISDYFLSLRDFGDFCLVTNGHHFYLVNDQDFEEDGLPKIFTNTTGTELIELTSLTPLQEGDAGFGQDKYIQYFYLAENDVNNSKN